MKFIKLIFVIFCVLTTSIACSKTGGGSNSSDTNPNGGGGSASSTQPQEKDKIMACLKSESHIVLGGFAGGGDSFKTISLKMAVASQKCAASEQDVIDYAKYLELHPGEVQ